MKTYICHIPITSRSFHQFSHISLDAIYLWDQSTHPHWHFDFVILLALVDTIQSRQRSKYLD